ncbi:hypothetical protein AB3X55_03025 [Alphaproteobacteria bacterium LSUCC0719]
MRLIFLILALSMLAAPASAHKCILGGSTATDIQIYNSCKADLATGVAGHRNDGSDDNDQAAALLRLEAENESLRARLAAVKRHLLDILAGL